MNKELIGQMQSQFDALARSHADMPEVEFWFARDMQEPLGYARWENLITAIQRVIEPCRITGSDAEHHFRGVTILIKLGRNAKRPVHEGRRRPPMSTVSTKKSEGRGLSGEPSTTRHGAEFHLPMPFQYSTPTATRKPNPTSPAT